jgi:hypothetical protein
MSYEFCSWISIVRGNTDQADFFKLDSTHCLFLRGIMAEEDHVLLSNEQEPSSLVESRIQLFDYFQSTSEYIGGLVYKIVDWFTNRGCFLKLEVKGSAESWSLVLLFELRS